MERNRRITLARRPVGLPEPDDFAADEVAVPELAEGEALMRVRYLSIDPTIRTWISEARSYFPPVALGEVVRASGAGEIVATRCDAYQVGDLVTSLPGWQEYAVVRDDVFTTRVPEGISTTDVLGALGQNGMTAYVGLIDIGRPREGETVVISGAAGATGSVAGQIASILGCRVVGIAGSAEKCRWLTEELGFDAAIDYHDDGFADALRAATPDRIDIYFDNVGGWILDVVLHRLAMGGRIVLSGAISVYNDTTKPPGPANYLDLITARGRMEGFNTFDAWDRFEDITAQLAEWVADGSIVTRDTIVDGLDAAPEALRMLFEGANLGKLVVRLD
jgi:NADPH-dependent curcumin reductase CurA